MVLWLMNYGYERLLLVIRCTCSIDICRRVCTTHWTTWSGDSVRDSSTAVIFQWFFLLDKSEPPELSFPFGGVGGMAVSDEKLLNSSRLKQEQAYVRDEFGKILDRERISSNEHLTRAILRERAATEEERQKAQRFRLMDTVKFNLVLLEVEEGCALKLAKQLEEKDRELKKHDAYYKEQLARLEERNRKDTYPNKNYPDLTSWGSLLELQKMKIWYKSCTKLTTGLKQLGFLCQGNRGGKDMVAPHLRKSGFGWRFAPSAVIIIVLIAAYSV
ncbi:Coiled-coil-helix-coiled-coil-helix domain-containing protein 3, mitochondrial [Anas platyrhynchos]|uniref:Coiled-coil-helix-coiled-coil-helix domain-containing protein 3, mitochondrial n=1 Tax=Anas platyrhynchos TaxID=8839 RepID=R0LHB3_ANAPL|nr:Coiled-coil-helix-coiled-coil-helix domain-containing protein 3, mitochondrial [Anas platyrhynchos]